MNFQASVKTTNKQINDDLTGLSNWPSAKLLLISVKYNLLCLIQIKISKTIKVACVVKIELFFYALILL